MKDHSSMAREKGLSLTKSGYWLYQKRIPSNLQHYYQNKPSVRHYLGGISLAEANTQAAQFNAHYLTEWSRLKATPSPQQRTSIPPASPQCVAPELIPQLALAAFSKAVNHDEQARHSGTAIQPHERAKWFTNEHQDPREEAIAATKAAAARGDYSAFTEAAVRLLSNAGYSLRPDSWEVQELCRELAKGSQRYIQIQLKREQGEFTDSPQYTQEQQALLKGLGAIASLHSGAIDDNEGGVSLGVVLSYWSSKKKSTGRTLSKAEAAYRMLYAVIQGKPSLAEKKASVEAGEPWRHYPAASVRPEDVIALREFMLLDKSPKTVEGYISLITASYNKMVQDRRLPSNPAKGIQVEQEKFKTITEKHYTNEELRTLFSSPVFTQQERPKGGAGGASFWLPIIALFSGARLEELGGLLVTDVYPEGDYWLIRLDVNAVRRVKNESSRRILPLHPKLIELGLIDYHEQVKTLGHSRLFYELPERVNMADDKQTTKNWSQWFNRNLLTSVGIKAAGKNFHSFRHTLLTHLRGHTTDAIRRAISGHASGSIEDGYGTTLIKDKYDALCQLTYPSIDWSRIHYNKS